MLKDELIRAVQSKTGVTMKVAREAVDCVFETISDALANGDKVAITGFGQFIQRKRRARVGVNPQQPNQKIQLPESILPAFKPGKTLKDRVRKK